MTSPTSLVTKTLTVCILLNATLVLAQGSPGSNQCSDGIGPNTDSNIVKSATDAEKIAHQIGVSTDASVPYCNADKMAHSKVDDVCQIKTEKEVILWKVIRNDRYGQIFKDLKSGLEVTLVFDRSGRSIEYDKNGDEVRSLEYGPQWSAKSACSSVPSISKDGVIGPDAYGKFRLPTGYRKSENGLYGFPKHDSDIVTLEAHGVRNVVPGLQSNSGLTRFWTSSGDLPKDISKRFNGGSGEGYYMYFVKFGEVLSSGAADNGTYMCVNESD